MGFGGFRGQTQFIQCFQILILECGESREIKALGEGRKDLPGLRSLLLQEIGTIRALADLEVLCFVEDLRGLALLEPLLGVFEGFIGLVRDAVYAGLEVEPIGPGAAKDGLIVPVPDGLEIVGLLLEEEGGDVFRHLFPRHALGPSIEDRGLGGLLSEQEGTLFGLNGFQAVGEGALFRVCLVWIMFLRVLL
jgi:hypothetical protein